MEQKKALIEELAKIKQSSASSAIASSDSGDEGLRLLYLEKSMRQWSSILSDRTTSPSDFRAYLNSVVASHPTSNDA